MIFLQRSGFICGLRDTTTLDEGTKRTAGETKTGTFLQNKERNGPRAKRFRPLGSAAGQLGLLNRDPEERTQKPSQKTSRCFFFFFPLSLDLLPEGLCARRSERSLRNQIRLRSQSEAARH